MKENNKNINNDTFLAQWLEGTLTDTDLKKLVSKEDFLAYKKLKKGLGVFTELEKPLGESFTNIKNRIRNKPKVRTLNIKWIASIAAMLLFFFGFYQFLGSDGVLTSTNFGEQKTIALLDGSEVILNAKSAINYSKKEWENKREIYLNGEAFFKVKKGKKFTVKTKNGVVTVLGTQFNVKSTNNYFEVTCYQGSVKVFIGDKSFILKPTEAIRKINTKIENISYSNKAPSWITKESSYRSIPIQFVIADFEKQYHIKINATRINNKQLFTGSFIHNDIDTALKSIFEAMDLKYKKTANEIILYN